MQHALENEYDICVIGAGPGGLMSAMVLASAAPRLKIALLDKRDPWREPVACAEAVSKRGLDFLIPDLEKECIRELVNGVIFVAPDKTRVKINLPSSGYLIDRALMHTKMADRCRDRGVHCHFRARATDVSAYTDGKRMVSVSLPGQKSHILASRVVIDASGPGVGFGPKEGLAQGDFDLEPALFGLVKGLDYPVNYIQMFFGHNFAPGGYGWLFPRDKEVANVGIVVGKNYFKGVSARNVFKDFVNNLWPGVEVGTVHGGAIPCGQPLLPLAGDNLFKVGDAASMVNPISRAGILEAMTSGRYAAHAAIEILNLNHDSEKRKHYDIYRKKWFETYGKSYRGIHLAKKAFVGIPDKTFNRAAKSLSRLPQEKISLARVFMAALWASPGLLWRLRSMMIGR